MELARQLIKSTEAATRIDPQQLSPQLVVCEFGEQKLVIDHSAPKPRAYITMLARMADLTNHAGIDEEFHRVGLSTTGPVEL